MKHGFTLLELLLVLALIGLITGLIAPRLGGSLSGVKLKTATNNVAAMLRYARNQAVAEQISYKVVFDRKRQRVLFEAADDGKDSAAAEQKKIYQLPEEIELAGIKSGAEEDSGKDMVEFVFNLQGSCSGGEIVLADENRSYRIKLDRITGLVEVD